MAKHAAGSRKERVIGRIIHPSTRPDLPFHKRPDTRQIALFSMLISVTTALQILPRPLGLEFTSLLAFSAGIVLGGLSGATLGSLVMFVNAFASAWGEAGINLPFQMLGMSLIGAVGGIYKVRDLSKTRFCVENAVLGAFLTFVYYTFFANLGFALYLSVFQTRMPLPFLEAFVFSQVNGAVFTLLYTVSNAFLFGVGSLPLVSAMQKTLGR